jgi:hypothetical protein
MEKNEMELSMCLRAIIKRILIVVSITISTSASALVVYDPNGIYMIGASVNAQLYNTIKLSKDKDGNVTFSDNEGVYSAARPEYFSSAVDNKNKIFWGQIPGNYDLHFVPAVESTITSMMTEYKSKVTEAFSPIIPGFVLVGWVGSMCKPAYNLEGLKGIKSQTYNLILHSNPSTRIVLMKYPTEGLDFSDVDYCLVGGVRGDYFSNARNYNRYIEYLRLLFASVTVIDPWKTYSTKYPEDTVHADDDTLEKAAIRIGECFENGFPLSCKDKP